ncbi:MAG: hypothetical protein LC664_02015, partial [Flavobacteriales bacterium]|nr:hypothetical protein [Flavobacteriales bacterium]
EDNVKSLTAGAKGQKMIVVHVENKVSYEACIAVLDDLLMSGSVKSNAKNKSQDEGIIAERQTKIKIHLALEP